MRKCGFSPTRILPYKDRIHDSVLIREIRISENSYSHMFCAMSLCQLKIYPPYLA